MTPQLLEECEHRKATGQTQVSFTAFKHAYEALGYTFDRSCDVRSIARYLTGERAGKAYPYLGLYPLQKDNRLSAWNVDARRDENYEAFRVLRRSIFAVMQNRIVEL